MTKTMASDKLAKIEMVLKAIERDAQRVEDFELGDQIGRSIAYALELLEDVQLESDESATDELAIAT